MEILSLPSWLAIIDYENSWKLSYYVAMSYGHVLLAKPQLAIDSQLLYGAETPSQNF